MFRMGGPSMRPAASSRPRRVAVAVFVAIPVIACLRLTHAPRGHHSPPRVRDATAGEHRGRVACAAQR